MRTALALPLLAACAARGGLEEGQVAAWQVAWPEGARPGMFLTWRTERDRARDDDVVEETDACVAPGTMEWRETRRDGATTVTAARYAADGTLLGAWRGPEGGVGTPIEVVDRRVDVAEAAAEADRLGGPLGLSTKSARAVRETAVEEIETPAGRFRCFRDTVRMSLLVTSGSMTAWVAERPVLFTRLVRLEMRGPFSFYEREELVACGASGAAPTLRPP